MLKVTNEHLLNIFNQLWIKSWEEMGFELEFNENSDKYLIPTDTGQYVGTFELKKYTGSDTEKFFSFLTIKQIRDNISTVMEIDKLSIQKEYRGKKVLPNLLSHLIDYAIEYDIKYAVALIEPKLFSALKIFYKLPIKKVGKKLFYKGDNVIPIIIDAQLIKDNLTSYKWYTGNHAVMTSK